MTDGLLSTFTHAYQVFGDKGKVTRLTMAWRVLGDEMGIGNAIGRADLPHLAALAQ